MSSSLTRMRFSTSALLVLALVLACSLGAAPSAPASSAFGGAPAHSSLALHATPFSAMTVGANPRARALRVAEATPSVGRLPATLTGRPLDPLPTVCGGIQSAPFSLRLRI